MTDTKQELTKLMSKLKTNAKKLEDYNYEHKHAIISKNEKKINELRTKISKLTVKNKKLTNKIEELLLVVTIDGTNIDEVIYQIWKSDEHLFVWSNELGLHIWTSDTSKITNEATDDPTSSKILLPQNDISIENAEIIMQGCLDFLSKSNITVKMRNSKLIFK